MAFSKGSSLSPRFFALPRFWITCARALSFQKNAPLNRAIHANLISFADKKKPSVILSTEYRHTPSNQLDSNTAAYCERRLIVPPCTHRVTANRSWFRVIHTRRDKTAPSSFFFLVGSLIWDGRIARDNEPAFSAVPFSFYEVRTHTHTCRDFSGALYRLTVIGCSVDLKRACVYVVFAFIFVISRRFARGLSL